MKDWAAAIVVGVSVVLAGPAKADDLSFPKTEAEIVEALSLKDGRTVYQGVEYVSENQRVYKIVKGKRYRVRGLAGIVDTDLVPRAGALVQFDFNSAAIRRESHAILDEFGKALAGGLAGAGLMLTGHTDSKGSEAINVRLSRERAEAVRDYLVRRHGVAEGRLTTRGYGETRPIASNDSEHGRAMNRRVEFIRVE